AIADQETAVLERLKRVVDCERVVGSVQDRSPQDLVLAHGRACRSDRTRWTAKNTRSGVAGLSKVTRSSSPNAATASRSASRTEIASISGGSPMALLPPIVPGCAAPERNSTSKRSGTSDHDGSL